MIKSFFSNALHAAVTLISLALIISVVLFSHKTTQVDLSVGDASTEDIYAPRTIIDTTTTNASREAARKTVENVYVSDDEKRLGAVEKITDFFAVASTLRSDDTLNAASSAAQLQTRSKLDVSSTSARTIIAATKSEFSLLRDISNIVDSVMLTGVSDLNAGLESCKEEISALDLTQNQKEAAQEIVSLVLTVNLELDESETERRRDAAAAAVPDIEYKKNQIIVRKGDLVSEAQYNMLETLGLLKGSNPISPTYTTGLSFLMIIGYIIILFHTSGREKKNPAATPITSVTALLIILMTFYGSKYVPENMAALLPAGLFPGIVTIFSTPLTAILTNLVLSVFCAVAFEANWGYTVCLILAGTLCSYCFATVKRRSHLLPASFVSSLFYGFVFCAMSLIESSSVLMSLTSFAKGFAGGFLSGLITIGSLPLLEWIFNATTPMKLSELANPENKLLKKLLVEAPGTYHHSLTVANISEIAARSIHADALLARVGAYYHDIGKLRHPLYFKENQYDKNAHDNLAPEESSSLIISHVTEGVEIAAKNHLPQSICDIIAQHHGKTTTGYFLIRAKEKDPDVDEAKFTYPGPVPQTKEAAIVMLADSCEAAVRSIEDKSESKIDVMVRKIVTDRVSSGQFAECNLTFSELETIIKVITKTLGGYFHERIKYE